MSNVRFDELELMLMAMFEQPTLRDTIQVLQRMQRWLRSFSRPSRRCSS